jgi:uncharacterized membrane protein
MEGAGSRLKAVQVSGEGLSRWRGAVLLFLGCGLSLAALPYARGADLERGLQVFLGFLLLWLLFVLAEACRAPFAFRIASALESLAVRLERALSPSRAAWCLGAGMLLYALFWSFYSIARHSALNSSGFDLAIQHQVLWNLAHGRGFESSIEVGNYLGDHIALILPPLSAVLWIWDDVRSLLIMQSLTLALGAWPTYRLASRRCGGRLPGLLWAGAYLLTPAIGYMNRYDFHDLVIALPLLLAALDAIDARRYGWASVWLALAVLTREEVGLGVAAIGIWAAWRLKRPVWGGAVFLLALSWSVIALFVLIPHFRGGEGSDTLMRYVWLGETPADVLATLATHPWSLFATHYHRVRRIFFLVQLLWPFAFLPLLGRKWLWLAIPNLGLSITSSAISQNSIYFQYNAPILPFVLAAGIEGYRRIRTPGRAALILASGLLFANIADPAALKGVGRPYTIVDGIHPRSNAASFEAAAHLIPPDASLIAGNDLAPHFSERRELAVYQVRRPNPPAAWIILDVTDRRHLMDPVPVHASIAAMVGQDGYRAGWFRDGILVLRREGEEDSTAAACLRDSLNTWGFGSP